MRRKMSTESDEIEHPLRRNWAPPTMTWAHRKNGHPAGENCLSGKMDLQMYGKENFRDSVSTFFLSSWAVFIDDYNANFEPLNSLELCHLIY